MGDSVSTSLAHSVFVMSMGSLLASCIRMMASNASSPFPGATDRCNLLIAHHTYRMVRGICGRSLP